MPFEQLSSNIFLTIGIGCLLAALFITALLTLKQRRRERQLLGLRWVGGVRLLLSHIQQHRGLTHGFVSGGKAVFGDIEALQRKVSRDLAKISALDPAIEENERWQQITQRWAQLAGNYRRLDPAENMRRHNRLIKRVLYLIDEIAQDTYLLSLRNKDHTSLHSYWRELLMASESIGQARALGTGVAAAGYCDRQSKDRLRELCSEIENNTRKLRRDVQPGSNDSPKLIKILIDCINEHILRDRPTVTPEEYFALASRAIDSLFDQFDRMLAELQWD